MNDTELLELIEKEGMKKEFIYKGYNCLIRRTPMKILCGYVEIPKEHKLFGVEIDEGDYDVHGGITWNGGDIEDSENGDKWYVGFDCAHCCDLIPYEIGRYPSFISDMPSNDVYRTMDYVEQEIKKLVNQLEEVVK